MGTARVKERSRASARKTSIEQQQEDAVLIEEIREIFHENRCYYGSSRIHRDDAAETNCFRGWSLTCFGKLEFVRDLIPTNARRKRCRKIQTLLDVPLPEKS